MTLWNLFISFFQVGLFTFGGGYAMLPMFEKECVDKHGWLTYDELLDVYAIGQCTPGIIAVNVATYVGTKKKGVLGGIVATLGMVAPSFLIISLLAPLISLFKDNPYVLKAFAGIRIAVCALIGSSIYKLAKKAFVNIPCFLIALVSLVLQLFFALSPIIIVFSTVFITVLFYVFFEKSKETAK